MKYWLMVPSLGFDVGAVAFGALASRADRRTPLGPARSHKALMVTAALLSAAMALAPLAPSPALASILVGVSLVGGGGVFALLTADMLTRVSPSVVSTAGGLTAAAQSLAYIVANPLVGKAVDASHSYGAVLVVLGAIVPPAVLAWCVWPVRT
jgi:MFS family permease